MNIHKLLKKEEAAGIFRAGRDQKLWIKLPWPYEHEGVDNCSTFLCQRWSQVSKKTPQSGKVLSEVADVISKVKYRWSSWCTVGSISSKTVVLFIASQTVWSDVTFLTLESPSWLHLAGVVGVSWDLTSLCHSYSRTLQAMLAHLRSHHHLQPLIGAVLLPIQGGGAGLQTSLLVHQVADHMLQSKYGDCSCVLMSSTPILISWRMTSVPWQFWLANSMLIS